jgi:hypothetical protein
MRSSPKIGDLSSAVNLITQPLVLESLQAIDEGKALQDALPPDADMVALNAAVQRLAVMGAIEPSAAGPSGRHTLTDRGRLLLELLEELESLVPTPHTAGWPR